MFTTITKTQDETRSLGMRLARLLKGGDIVALTGEMGSGKTTFTKGIAEGLGVANVEYVNSPSFVLVKEYSGSPKGRPSGRLNLYHFDLYRLNGLYDIEYVGLKEYMDGRGVIVIEWAEKLKTLLPEEYLQICIKIIAKDKRKFEFKAYGRRYDTLVRRYLK